MQRENYKPLPHPPLSHAVRMGPWIYVSGQIGMDGTGQIVPGGLEAQTRQVIENIRMILESMGSGLGKVVKTTCFLVDKSDFPAMNRVYGEYFGTNPPARSTVAVKELMQDGLLVEIEAVACL